MKIIKHIYTISSLILFFNLIFIFALADLHFAIKIILALSSVIHILGNIFKAPKITIDSKKLRHLNHGCNLIMYSGFSAVIQTFLTIAVCMKTSAPLGIVVANSIFAGVFIIIMSLGGIIKTSVTASQVKFIWYILLFLFWYIPPLNIIIFSHFYKIGKREFRFEVARLDLEKTRSKNNICSTKYPVLMVHGIFFRDWQYFNYWGRVPKSLVINGAEIYYGNQQSANSVAKSAEELKKRIIEVINESGAEKVNIIAHSKGGLDSRYAISLLGMDKYVASLTTINTPHNGCLMVDRLYDILPQNIINFIAKKYNAVFTKLGDKSPDFLKGINDLRASVRLQDNTELADSPDIFYQSFMSEMKNCFSAGFPLNLGYMIIKKCNGRNDGLVWIESAKHGENFTLIQNKFQRGISHGDMIDLFRENIRGFDVREFYIDIVKNLQKRGL